VTPALTVPMRLIFVVDEIVRVDVAQENDVATPAAIATVGPAPRFIFLAPKTDTTAPAITRRKLYCAFVNKHSIHDAEGRRFAKGVNPGRRDIAFPGGSITRQKVEAA